jgi:hypothetical protein
VEERGESRRRWVLAGAIAVGVLVVAGCCVVFLVLTGIIAEPETVIESIIRALSGR